eukprot:Opistho-1_new@70309
MRSTVATRSQKAASSLSSTSKNIPATKFMPWQYPIFGFLWPYASRTRRSCRILGDSRTIRPPSSSHEKCTFSGNVRWRSAELFLEFACGHPSTNYPLTSLDVVHKFGRTALRFRNELCKHARIRLHLRLSARYSHPHLSTERGRHALPTEALEHSIRPVPLRRRAEHLVPAHGPPREGRIVRLHEFLVLVRLVCRVVEAEAQHVRRAFLDALVAPRQVHAGPVLQPLLHAALCVLVLLELAQPLGFLLRVHFLVEVLVRRPRRLDGDAHLARHAGHFCVNTLRGWNGGKRVDSHNAPHVLCVDT